MFKAKRLTRPEQVTPISWERVEPVRAVSWEVVTDGEVLHASPSPDAGDTGLSNASQVERISRLATSLPHAPPLAFSQNSPPRFLAVQTITLERGMIDQFEHVARRVTEAFTRTSDEPQVVEAFSVVNGRESRSYLFVWGFNDQTAMDTWRGVPAVLTTAYGEDQSAEILLTLDQSIATNKTTINLLLTDASSAPEHDSLETPRRATLIDSEIRYDKLEDYNLFLKQLKEAEEAAGVSWQRRRQARGRPNVFSSVRLHENMSDTAPTVYDLLREHVGPLEAKTLIARQLDAVIQREIVTLVHRPALSWH